MSSLDYPSRYGMPKESATVGLGLSEDATVSEVSSISVLPIAG